MNNVLSKRLLAIASMIEDEKTVYDVGCDHAYLDIYLTLTRSIKCYAIDIRPSVIKIAKQNIEKYGVNIPVLLNNGIDNLIIEKNSTVVIAGMGTRTILKILKQKNVDEVIIQSNDDLPLLRSSLSAAGYQIVDERVVLENGYFYVLIKFKKGSFQYTDSQFLLGPILMLDRYNQIYINYLKYLINKFNKMISNVPDDFYENKIEILKKKACIEEYLSIIK